MRCEKNKDAETDLGLENVEHSPARNCPPERQDEVHATHERVLAVASPVHVLFGAYLPEGHVQSMHCVVSKLVVPLHAWEMNWPLAHPCLAQSEQTRSEAVVPEQGMRMNWPAPDEEQDGLQSVHCPS